MASRISQMRNAMWPQPQQPQQLSQQQLNESIARTRALMERYRGMSNPETIITNLLQNNPQLGYLSTLLRQGNKIEDIAKNMAIAKGYDINEVINGLNKNSNI